MSSQQPVIPGVPATHHGQLIQLCFVVQSLAEAMRYYSNTFGAGPWFIGPQPTDAPDTMYRGVPTPLGARIALGYAGEVMYELVCPEPGSRSIFSEWVDDHGYCLHHFGFAVRDFDATFATLRSEGRTQLLTGRTPRGARVVIVDALGSHGALEEFIEMTPASERFYALMKTAAARWDRSDLTYSGSTEAAQP